MHARHPILGCLNELYKLSYFVFGNFGSLEQLTAVDIIIDHIDCCLMSDGLEVCGVLRSSGGQWNPECDIIEDGHIQVSSDSDCPHVCVSYVFTCT